MRVWMRSSALAAAGACATISAVARNDVNLTLGLQLGRAHSPASRH